MPALTKRLFRIAQLAFVLLLTLRLSAVASENLSALGRSPDWSSLEQYQETITHDDFDRLLRSVYCTRGVDEKLIKVETESARFLIDRDAQTFFTLRFAKDQASARPVSHSWRAAASLGKAPAEQPLAGVKIALDPGHIGGRWAQMEERWYQVSDSKPVQEGDMTLLVAQLLVPQLEKLGATVSLVRDQLEPVTPKRPEDLRDAAREILQRAGEAQPREDFDGPADPEKEHTVRWESEILFYRNSEIRQRAEIVNTVLRPDVVLCLHFNAEAWNDPRQPTLIDRNHLHLLVNGSYLPPELELDDVRFEMLRRLLSRTHQEEVALAAKLAPSMARRTHLPPYVYTTDNVTKLGDSGYVYLRNLIATRLYHAPVVYFEPYVMNCDEVFWRIQEGDYDGIRNVNGTDRPSIFREYAAGIVDGLVEYYRAAR
ncbi:MAG: hypothetical protein M3Y80_10350 [Verrucomicrobiota bacterium]|nr:hypothetical protein [Verrucomicrobiota bacterium]